MKTKLVVLISFLLISVESFSQFFIPIILSYPQNIGYQFICPTRDKIAYDAMNKGFKNFNENIEVSKICFKEAIKQDSSFCDAYDLLTSCYRKTKDFDNAMQTINLSLKKNPSNYRAKKTKGLIYYFDFMNYKEAAIYFRQLYKEQPKEGMWLYYYTESLIKLDSLDEAQDYALKMEFVMNEQEGWESSDISLYLQGKIACKKKNYQGALKAFDTVKDTYRNNSEFCYYYGLCYLNCAEPDMKKAKKYITKAVKNGYIVEYNILNILDKTEKPQIE